MNLQSIFRDLGMKLGAWYQGVTWEMSRAEAGIHVSGLQDEDDGFGSSLDPMDSDVNEFMFETPWYDDFAFNTSKGNAYYTGDDD